MQKQKFSHRFITILFQGLSVLLIDFAVNYITSKIFLLKGFLSNSQITLLTMILALILFLFLLNLVTRLTNWILRKAVESANHFKHTKTIMIMMMLIIYSGIFSLYHHLWFQRFPTLKDAKGLIYIPDSAKAKRHFR